MSSIDGGASPAMLRIAIVIPVFNDWVAFAVLCRNLDSLSPSWGVRLSILAVDDGSHEPLPQDARLERLNNIDSIEILALACNLGHQRAIAVGLAAVLDKGNIDAVVVTDGDGEDRPEDIGRMIDAHRHDRKSLIVGRRTTRSESASFQVFYRLYKLCFVCLPARRSISAISRLSRSTCCGRYCTCRRHGITLRQRYCARAYH